MAGFGNMLQPGCCCVATPPPPPPPPPPGCPLPAGNLLITWYGNNTCNGPVPGIFGPYTDNLIYYPNPANTPFLNPIWQSNVNILPKELFCFPHYDDGSPEQVCILYRFTLSCGLPTMVIEESDNCQVTQGQARINLPACELPPPGYNSGVLVGGLQTDGTQIIVFPMIVSRVPFVATASNPNYLANFFAYGVITG